MDPPTAGDWELDERVCWRHPKTGIVEEATVIGWNSSVGHPVLEFADETTTVVSRHERVSGKGS